MYLSCTWKQTHTGEKIDILVFQCVNVNECECICVPVGPVYEK